ncbi:MAG TPA: TlpA disulfide reductase family protein [Candidatus Binatia bacterium]|nr:TlpA disulfide reductase family protein [Candidatus Binatia bacterium]
MAGSRGLRIAIVTALVGVTLAAGLWFVTHRGPQRAPDFAVSDLEGRTVRLSALRGKVVVLNLWTTWCPPCLEEMPSMERLWTTLGGDDFALLAVSQDEDGRRAVESFVARTRVTFPVYLDPEHQVGDRYGVWGYPETFVIDRNGFIVERVIGPRDWSTPEAITQLRALIAARDEAPRAAGPSPAPAPRGPS